MSGTGRSAAAPWPDGARRPRGPTLFDEAAEAFDGLCGAVDLRARQADLRDVLRALTASWGGRHVDEPPRWSGVTDDASPFEFSIAVTAAGVEVRMLVEAQSDPASPATYFDAGRDLNRRLEAQYGADLAAFCRVEDLFRPTDPNATFAVWHAVTLRRDGRHEFKVYLNPAAQGRERARTTVEEACRRLGLSEAWQEVGRAARRQDHPHFFSLALWRGARGAKVYLRHGEATAAVVERAAAIASGHVASDVVGFVETMAEASDLGRGRPPITAYHLAPGRPRPARACTHLPCSAYAPDDAAAVSRVRALLVRHGLPIQSYVRAVSVLARRPLEAQAFIHSYVSFQRQDGSPRVTTYLCPGVYVERFGPVARDPGVMWPSPCSSRSRADRPDHSM